MTPEPPLVLVVEDVEDIRELIALNLRLEGFTVATASNGDEALALLAQQMPAAITLDVAMPPTDGWVIAERVRGDAAGAGVALVIVSALVQRDDQSKGERFGVDAYVTKPFDPDHLVRTVRRLVEARRLR